MVFWIVMCCGVTDGYHCFTGMYHLHLQGYFNPENEGNTFLRYYPVSKPRKPQFTLAEYVAYLIGFAVLWEKLLCYFS
jgi:hypothetical protein